MKIFIANKDLKKKTKKKKKKTGKYFAGKLFDSLPFFYIHENYFENV